MNYPARLLIQAPRVICHSTDQDGPAQVALQQGKIDHVKSLAAEMPVSHLNFHDAILLPGLIDLHWVLS